MQASDHGTFYVFIPMHTHWWCPNASAGGLTCRAGQVHPVPVPVLTFTPNPFAGLAESTQYKEGMGPSQAYMFVAG